MEWSFKSIVTWTAKKYKMLLVLSLLIVLPLSSWVKSMDFMGSGIGPRYANHIGCPFPWLTVYSMEPGRSVWSLLFEGNEGLHVGLGYFISAYLSTLIGFFACAVTIGLCVQMVEFFKKRRKAKRAAE